MKKAFRIEEITEAVPNTNLQKRVDMVLYFGEEEIWRKSSAKYGLMDVCPAIKGKISAAYPFLISWGQREGHVEEINTSEHILPIISVPVNIQISNNFSNIKTNKVAIKQLNEALKKAIDLCGYKEPTIQKKCSCGKIAAKKDNFCSKCGEKLRR